MGTTIDEKERGGRGKCLKNKPGGDGDGLGRRKPSLLLALLPVRGPGDVLEQELDAVAPQRAVLGVERHARQGLQVELGAVIDHEAPAKKPQLAN